MVNNIVSINKYFREYLLILQNDIEFENQKIRITDGIL